MKVVCVGADPAALYLGILLKRRDASHSVRFVETDGGTAPLPSSIVCNPLKRRLKLADAEVAAAANAAVATFDRVAVDAGDHRFETRGLAYASVSVAGVVDVLKDIAAKAGCGFERCASDAMAAPPTRLIIPSASTSDRAWKMPKRSPSSSPRRKLSKTR
jgi:hypothetical protein